MNKLLPLAALTLSLSAMLTACSGGKDTVNLTNNPGDSLPKHVNITIGNIEPTDSNSTTNSFTFTALPGSDAVNFVGYRIVKAHINNQDYINTDSTYKNIFLYVPSGYSCSMQTTLAAKNQSCNINDQNTVQATGVTETLSLDLSSAWHTIANTTMASDGSYLDIQFLGVSSRNEKVILTTYHVKALPFKPSTS